MAAKKFKFDRRSVSVVSNSSVESSAMSETIVVEPQSQTVLPSVPAIENKIVCKGCGATKQQHGACGAIQPDGTVCLVVSRNRGEQRVAGDKKYSSVDELQNWKAGDTTPSVYSFADEQHGMSVLYSRVMAEVVLPRQRDKDIEEYERKIKQHIDTSRELSGLSGAQVEEYVDIRRAKNSIQKAGAPAAIQALLAMGITREQLTAMLVGGQS